MAEIIRQGEDSSIMREAFVAVDDVTGDVVAMSFGPADLVDTLIQSHGMAPYAYETPSAVICSSKDARQDALDLLRKGKGTRLHFGVRERYKLIVLRRDPPMRDKYDMPRGMVWSHTL